MAVYTLDSNGQVAAEALIDKKNNNFIYLLRSLNRVVINPLPALGIPRPANAEGVPDGVGI